MPITRTPAELMNHALRVSQAANQAQAALNQQSLWAQQSSLQNGNISAANQAIGQSARQQALSQDYGFDGGAQAMAGLSRQPALQILGRGNFPSRQSAEVYFPPAPEPQRLLIRMPNGEVHEVVTRPIAATPEPAVEPEPPASQPQGRSRWERLLDEEDLV